MQEEHAHPIESMPLAETRELQAAALRSQVGYVWDRSPFYRRKLAQAGISTGDIKGLEDLSKIPFTTKEEIRASLDRLSPLGEHLAADLEDLVQFHASSGTTGRPSYVGLTMSDLRDWIEIMRRAFWATGIRPGDRVLHALGMSRGWVGGLPVVQSLQALGAAVIPVGAEPGSAWLLNVIRDLEPDCLAATPNFAVYLGEQSDDILGVPAKDLSIRRIYTGGEPGGGILSLRARADELWDAEMREGLGGTDICPILWADCEDRTGMHFMAGDSVIFEVLSLDDKTSLEIEEGIVGELVYSHLRREATPVLRFLHRDIVQVTGTRCACGRTGPKIRCLGRTDDMFIVKGINVYPSAIQDVVMMMRPDVTGALKILKDSPAYAIPGPLHVRVEKGEHVPGEDESVLARRIEDSIYEMLRCRTVVEIVPPETFGKPGREKLSLIERTYEL